MTDKNQIAMEQLDALRATLMEMDFALAATAIRFAEAVIARDPNATDQARYGMRLWEEQRTGLRKRIAVICSMDEEETEDDDR